MTPYYQDEFATIYNGNCKDIIQNLEKVDLLLTDPPYRQSMGGGGLIAKRSTYQSIGKTLSSFDISDYWTVLSQCTKNQHGYIFCSKNTLPELCNKAIGQDLSWDILIYGKNNPIPMKNNRYLSSFEFLFFFRGKNCYWNNDANFKSYSKIKMTNSKPSKFDHPTEKDISIIKQIVEVSTDMNHTILDPFLGSGTTLIAAKQMGRKAIGIELEEKYCEIAAKRLQETSKENKIRFV